MPWDSTNGIMTAPLSIADISDALQSTSSDLGTLVQDTRGLCNMWARYKPIQSNVVGYLTEAQRAAANFGLSATEQTTPELAGNPLNGWHYSPPLSGYYRMFDYVKVSDAGVPSTSYGYTTATTAPCLGFYAGSDSSQQLTFYQYTKGASSQDDIIFIDIPTSDNTAISFSDMGGISSWYLCIAVIIPSPRANAGTYILTANQAIGQGASGYYAWKTVSVLTDNNIFNYTSDATLSAIAVLCNTQHSSAWYNVASDSSLRFLPLPVFDPSIMHFSFGIHIGGYSAWPSGAYRLTSGTSAQRRIVHLTIYGKNDTGTPQYVDVLLKLWSTINPGTIIQTQSYNSITINDTSGSTVVLVSNATIGNQAVESAASGTLHVTATVTKSLDGTYVNEADCEVLDDPQPFPDR